LLAKIWTRINELTAQAIKQRDQFPIKDFEEQLSLKSQVKDIQNQCVHELTPNGGFCKICNLCMWD